MLPGTSRMKSRGGAYRSSRIDCSGLASFCAILPSVWLATPFRFVGRRPTTALRGAATKLCRSWTGCAELAANRQLWADSGHNHDFSGRQLSPAHRPLGLAQIMQLQRKSGMTGRTAAWPRVGQWPVWAVLPPTDPNQSPPVTRFPGGPCSAPAAPPPSRSPGGHAARSSSCALNWSMVSSPCSSPISRACMKARSTSFIRGP